MNSEAIGGFLSIIALHMPEDCYYRCHILIVQKHLNKTIYVLLNVGDVAGTSLRKLTRVAYAKHQKRGRRVATVSPSAPFDERRASLSP